ncbi:MAG TPA: rod shape-determining protein MreC [Thermomicrobiales bacterium]|nr:rod shape-determining protein MreC [Thermomicrobiales bacterium]
MSTLTVRQTVMLLLLFIVTSAALIGLDSRNVIDPFKGSLQDGLSVLTGGLGRLGEGGDPSELEAEIARLRAENDALRVENTELRGVARDNEQLRAQLDIEAQYPEYELLSAGVLSYDPANLEKFIIIDKGADDGVRKGMAVVDPNYYVGQVTEVWPSTARVMLLIDGTQRIAARLVDSGATGVLEGMWQVGGRAQLGLVDSDTEPKPGEQVVTVGGEQGTVGIPSRLVVGVVGKGIKRDEQSDLLTIPVVPYSDFDNLRVVTVVMEIDDDADSESEPDA